MEEGLVIEKQKSPNDSPIPSAVLSGQLKAGAVAG